MNSTEPDKQSPGRPRVLDDTKIAEICALLSAGCGIREAARYVRCDPSTIHREADRNPDFHNHLQRAIQNAKLSPLQAMQQAVNTHWRAAAWMLERTRPERFARPLAKKNVTERQARALVDELIDIVHDEINNPLQLVPLEKRIRAAVHTATGHASHDRASTSDVRRAQRFFDERDRTRRAAAAHAPREPKTSAETVPFPPSSTPSTPRQVTSELQNS